MPDRSRIVEIDPHTGLVTTVLNLDDFNGLTGRYYRERDSFTVTPPAVTPANQAVAGLRGGQRAIGAAYDNGSIGATWRVGADPAVGVTADRALKAAGDLIRTVDEKVLQRPGRYFEWRPINATQSTFFEIRGPGTFTPAWSPIRFEYVKTLSVSCSWPVAPYTVQAPMHFDDTFDQATALDAFTFLSGAGSVSQSNGELVPSTSGSKIFYRNDRAPVMDGELDLEFYTGTTAAGRYGVGFRGLDDNNYLFVWLDVASQLRIGKVDLGTPTSLATASYVGATATAYWVRARYVGNEVRASLYTTDPSLGLPPVASVTYTLTGADATKFGDGITGRVMVYAPDVPTTTARFRTLRSRPYTYRDQLLPARIDLRGIPGDLPPRVDVEVAASHPNNRAWFALGWSRRLGAAGSQPLGPVDLTNVSGFISQTGVPDGGLGGTLWNHTNSGPSGTAELRADVRVDSLEPDVGTDECLVDVFLMMRRGVGFGPMYVTLSHYGFQTAGVNEKQLLVNAGYASGTATLTLGPTGGQVTTAAIAGNLTAAQLQAVIDTAAGTGRVLVTGSQINSRPGLTIEYIGPWGQTDVPTLTIGAGWTGAGSVTVVQTGSAATNPVGPRTRAVDFPSGRLLPVQPTFLTWLLEKVGTISLPVKGTSAIVPVQFSFSYSAATGGTMLIDYALVLPAARSVRLRTGIPLDASYPRFMPSTGDYVKKVLSDRSTLIRPRDAAGGWVPSTGIGGSAIEPTLDDSGACSMIAAMQDQVPDDTTSSTSDAPTTRADLSFNVWPRYRFAVNG